MELFPPPYLNTKNRNKTHSIKIMGINAHLPIISPKVKATIMFMAVMRNGEIKTIRFGFFILCFW